jgi:hypothetical protein
MLLECDGALLARAFWRHLQASMARAQHAQARVTTLCVSIVVHSSTQNNRGYIHGHDVFAVNASVARRRAADTAPAAVADADNGVARWELLAQRLEAARRRRRRCPHR